MKNKIFLTLTAALFLAAPFAVVAVDYNVILDDIVNFELDTLQAVPTTITAGSVAPQQQVVDLDVQSNYINIGVYTDTDITFNTTVPGQYLKLTPATSASFTVTPACPTSTARIQGTGGPAVTVKLEVTTDVPSCLGITVTPVTGLVTTEAGGTATFTVVLNTQPTANVTIGITSSDLTECTVSPASLTFTPVNWATPQTVTVTGVDDAAVDGNIAYTIVTAAAVSTDSNYSGKNPSDVAVTNMDNDTTPGGGGGGGGGGGTTTPTCSLKINNNDITTNSLQVMLNIIVGPSATDMLISNDSNFTGTNWMSYSLNKDWTLLGSAAEYGVKTVYVKVKNSSGSISPVCSDTIEYLAGVLPPGIFVGELVKRADMDTVYFIDDDFKRHAFPNPSTYFSWFESFAPVRTISAETMASITLGANVTIRPGTYLIKIQSIPKVFAVEPGGVIRWVTSEEVAVKLWGNKWNERVIDINPAFYINYQEGSTITGFEHPTGSLVQWAAGTRVYYVENNTRRYITNEIFKNNKYQNRFVYRQLTPDFFYINAADYPALDISTIMILR